MGNVVKPFEFTNQVEGGPAEIIDADQVNANFDTVYDAVNGNLDDQNVKPQGISAVSLKDDSLGWGKTGVGAAGLAAEAFIAQLGSDTSVSRGNKIPLAAASFDPSARFAASTYTVVTAGLYVVQFFVKAGLNVPADETITAQVGVNGSVVLEGGSANGASTGDRGAQSSGGGLLVLAAGHEVTLTYMAAVAASYTITGARLAGALLGRT